MFLSSVLFGQTTSVPKQKNCKRICCVACPVKAGLLQQLFAGHAKEPATETTASPEHCCNSCHSNKEVWSHHSSFSVSYTGYLLKCVLTTKSCLLCTAAWMAQPPSTFRNWYPTTFQGIICGLPPNLVFASLVLTKETTKKHLGVGAFSSAAS